MASQTELAAALDSLTAQTLKNKQEVLDKIAALEVALAGAGATTAEVDTALANLKGAVQAADDDVPAAA